MFLPQIKVYSEVGGKPQTWDQHQKGTVAIPYYYYDYYDEDHRKEAIKFLHLSMKSQTFVQLSLTEYVFVSLSLALVIAKFFPAVHNQIVSRATRLEHQSLYWGTAVISNVFTYGLIFTFMRGLSITQMYFFDIVFGNINSHDTKSILILVPSVQEMVIQVILFVGAIVASLRNKNGLSFPIPRGMANIIIKLSFCWSCFCCCVCCSPQCRAKTMRVLVLFSFMSFVYHSVMDVISVAFVLFIEEYRVTIVTLTLLYISFLVFLILFVSFSLLGLFHSRSNDVLHYQNFITCFGSLCILFPAIMLTLVMYTIVIISLNLKGVTGILTGLIPTIALSAASWYIKKRLVKEMSLSNTATSLSECGGTVNDGERGETEDTSDDQRMLLP